MKERKELVLVYSNSVKIWGFLKKGPKKPLIKWIEKYHVYIIEATWLTNKPWKPFLNSMLVSKMKCKPIKTSIFMPLRVMKTWKVQYHQVQMQIWGLLTHSWCQQEFARVLFSHMGPCQYLVRWDLSIPDQFLHMCTEINSIWGLFCNNHVFETA